MKFVSVMEFVQLGAAFNLGFQVGSWVFKSKNEVGGDFLVSTVINLLSCKDVMNKRK
jgi:hypothetical protein